jgi:4-hydroxy-tetrahydrodipicolinate synthase
MTNPAGRIGLNCALSTPFAADGAIDLQRLVAQAHWTLENGCDGITLFGTTGEGASIATAERRAVLAAVADAGFAMGTQVVAGVTASTVPGAIAQARAAYEAGCRALLMTPPFYFSEASEEGFFRWFATVFEGLGGALRDVLLYHIPSMTGVELSADFLARLRDAFPEAVIGVKDSTGSWASTEALLQRCGDLQILVGDERQIARAVRGGGSGTICGLANMRPDLLREAAWTGKDDPRITRLVEAIIADPFMPAIKTLIAHRTGDPAWRRMRPPLMPLGEAQARALVERYEAAAAAKAA